MFKLPFISLVTAVGNRSGGARKPSPDLASVLLTGDYCMFLMLVGETQRNQAEREHVTLTQKGTARSGGRTQDEDKYVHVICELNCILYNCIIELNVNWQVM